MALRDFYSFNQIPLESMTEGFAVDSRESEDLIPITSPVAPSSRPFRQTTPDTRDPKVTNALAVEMELHRQELLETLKQHPLAFRLLSELAETNRGEGVDYTVTGNPNDVYTEVVQDCDLVQPDIPVKHIRNDRGGLDSVYIRNHPQCTALETIHFFPGSLIRIANQVEKSPSCELTPYPDYKTRLIGSRNKLQSVRQQIIRNNTGLVAFIAYKQNTSNLGLDDLMQEGIVGLIKAIDRFDPHRNICFSTYAVFWIKQAISRLIFKQEKVVRLPIVLAEKAYVVFEVMRKNYLENNRWPTLEELQTKCSLSMDEIKTVSSYYQATHSLDAGISDADDDHTLMDSLQQKQFALPLKELIDMNLTLYLTKAIASLSEKEATILNMRFGLTNHKEMTLQAIADQLQITRERVRQIQNQALNKLKQQFGYELSGFLEPNDC